MSFWDTAAMFRTYEQISLVTPRQVFGELYNFMHQQYNEQCDNPAYLPVKSHNYNYLFLCQSQSKEMSQKLYHLSEQTLFPINNVTLSTLGSIIEGYLSDDNKLLAITYSEDKAQHSIFKKPTKKQYVRTLIYNVYSSRHVTIENPGYHYFHFLSKDVCYVFSERRGIQLMQVKNNLEMKSLSCSCKLQSGIYKYIQGFGPFVVQVIVQYKASRVIALIELLRYKENDLVQECVLSTNRFDFDSPNIQYEFKASFFPIFIIKQESVIQVFNFCRKESLLLTLPVQEDFIQTTRFSNFQQFMAHQERQFQALEFDGIIMLIRPRYVDNYLFVVVISANMLQKTKVQYTVVTPLISYDQLEFSQYCKVVHFCAKSEPEDVKSVLNRANRLIEDFYQGKIYSPLNKSCFNAFNYLPYNLQAVITQPESSGTFQIQGQSEPKPDISEVMPFFQQKVTVFAEQSDCISAASYSECTGQFMEASSSFFGKMLYFQFKPDQIASSSYKSCLSCTTDNSECVQQMVMCGNENQPNSGDMSSFLQPEIIDTKFYYYNDAFQRCMSVVPTPFLPWSQIATSRFRFFYIPLRQERCSDLLLYDLFHQSVCRVEAMIQIEDYDTFQNIYTYMSGANYRVRLDCLYHTLRRNLIIEACLYSGMISSSQNVTGMSNLWLDRLGHILSTGFVDTNMMSVIIFSRCFYATRLLLTYSRIPYCENILLAVINQLLRNTSSERDFYKLYTRFYDVPTEAVFHHRRYQSDNSENLFKIMNHASSQSDQQANIYEMSSQSNLISSNMFLPDSDGQTLQFFDHPYYYETQLTPSFLLLKQFEKIQLKTIENKYKRKNLNNQLILTILYNQLLTEELNYITVFYNLQYVFPVVERASLFDSKLSDSEHNLWAQIHYIVTSIAEALEYFGVQLDYQDIETHLYQILYATIQGTVDVIVDRLKDTRANSLRKHEIIISMVEVLEVLQVYLPAKLIQAIWQQMAFVDQDIRDYLNSIV